MDVVSTLRKNSLTREIINMTHRPGSLARFFCAISLLCSLASEGSDSLMTYFNHGSHNHYVEPYRHIERDGDNFEAVVIAAMAPARKRVWVAVHEFNLPNIARALVAKKEAGIDVRVIVENTYNTLYSEYVPNRSSQLDLAQNEKYAEFLKLADINHDGTVTKEEMLQMDALYILKQAKIPVIDDTADGSQGSGLMHHKFMIVDDKLLLASSANFTMSCFFGDMGGSDTRGNQNAMMIFNDAQVNALFAQEFLIMWGGNNPNGAGPDPRFGVQKPVRPPRTITLNDGTRVTIQFSPYGRATPWEETTNGLIGKTLSEAQASVHFMLFVFSEQNLADIMEKDHNKGVEIEGLIDHNFAYRYYSELLDMMGLQMLNIDNCEYSPKNHPWNNPIYSFSRRHS